MIEIKSSKRKYGYEWCTCCSKEVNTDRITFSKDGTGGFSIVLCDDCQKELAQMINERQGK